MFQGCPSQTGFTLCCCVLDYQIIPGKRARQIFCSLRCKYWAYNNKKAMFEVDKILVYPIFRLVVSRREIWDQLLIYIICILRIWDSKVFTTRYEAPASQFPEKTPPLNKRPKLALFPTGCFETLNSHIFHKYFPNCPNFSHKNIRRANKIKI